MKKNKHSRILKSKKNRRNKYKSKKHIQRGGAAAAAAPASKSISNEKLINRQAHYTKAIQKVQEMQLPNIEALLNKYFSGTNTSKFHPTVSLKVPFITDVQNMPGFTTDFYYEWYTERNPSFGTIISYDKDTGKFTENVVIDTTCEITSADGSPPTKHYIYEPLIAQICRDLCIILETKQYIEGNEKSTRNSKRQVQYKFANNKFSDISAKLIELLKNCEICIENNYNYLKICLIFINFLYILNLHLVKIQTTTIYTNTYEQKSISINELYNSIFNTSYIFFPTHQQLSYQSQVLLISSPIINFRIDNRHRIVHNLLYSPYNDFRHDVHNHAKNSQHYLNTKINISYNPNIWFENIKIFITSLSEYFFVRPEDNSNIKYTNISRVYIKDKRIFSFILFALLHENHELLFKKILPKLINLSDIETELIESLNSDGTYESFLKRLLSVAKMDNLNYIITTIITTINTPSNTELFNKMIIYFCNIIIDILKKDKEKQFINCIFTLNTYYKETINMLLKY